MKIPALCGGVADSLAERIVVEVPRLRLLPAGWLWAELDLDQQAELPASRPGQLRVSAATRSSGRHVPEVLARLRGTAVTHLQFEAKRTPVTRDAVTAAADQGILTILSRHLTATPHSAADLSAHAEELKSYGGAFMKIAYWAPTEPDWRIAVELLETWRHDDVPLSVTPMGTRRGRLAAALAGIPARLGASDLE